MSTLILYWFIAGCISVCGGQLLKTQCDHIPTENTIPTFEPRNYRFVPRDGIKAWLACRWKFTGDINTTFLVSIRIIKTGPSSTLKVYDNDTLLVDVESQNRDNVSLIKTSNSVLQIHFDSGFASLHGTGFEIELITSQKLSQVEHVLQATHEQRYLVSPGFPSSFEQNHAATLRWVIQAGECASGIQLSVLFMDIASNLEENECIDTLTFKTKGETSMLCMEREFRPSDGYFYFHFPEVEIVFETSPVKYERRFIMKYRSNSQIRMKPEETMNIYTDLRRDPEGLDFRFIDNYRGRGVFATWPFEENDFIAEYTTTPFIHKEPPYGIYLFEVKYDGKKMWLNPEEEDGTIGRLLNDNYKDPNAQAIVATGFDNKPHLCFFALKHIHIGDEITFNYGKGYYPWRTQDKNEECSGDSCNS